MNKIFISFITIVIVFSSTKPSFTQCNTKNQTIFEKVLKRDHIVLMNRAYPVSFEYEAKDFKGNDIKLDLEIRLCFADDTDFNATFPNLPYTKDAGLLYSSDKGDPKNILKGEMKKWYKVLNTLKKDGSRRAIGKHDIPARNIRLELRDRWHSTPVKFYVNVINRKLIDIAFLKIRTPFYGYESHIPNDLGIVIDGTYKFNTNTEIVRVISTKNISIDDASQSMASYINSNPSDHVIEHLGKGKICNLVDDTKTGTIDFNLSSDRPVYFLSKGASISDIQAALLSKNIDQIKIKKYGDDIFYMKPKYRTPRDSQFIVSMKTEKNGPFLVANFTLREGPLWLNGPSKEKKAIVCAHRGFFRQPGVPENSLLAFEYAILEAKKRGKNVDIMEVDIRKSKDGELVILHDGMSRTTNYYETIGNNFHPDFTNFISKGNKKVENLDWSEIEKACYKDRFWNNVKYLKILSLEDVFEYFGDRQQMRAKDALEKHFAKKLGKNSPEYNEAINAIAKYHPDVQNNTASIKVVLALDKLQIKDYKKAFALGKNYNIENWLLFKHQIIPILSNCGSGLSTNEIKFDDISSLLDKGMIYTPIVGGKFTAKVPKINELEIQVVNEYIINKRNAGYLVPAVEYFFFRKNNFSSFKKAIRDLSFKRDPNALNNFDQCSGRSFRYGYSNKKISMTNAWMGCTALLPINRRQFSQRKIAVPAKQNQTDNPVSNRYNDMGFNLEHRFNYFITDMYDYVLDYLISLDLY